MIKIGYPAGRRVVAQRAISWIMPGWCSMTGAAITRPIMEDQCVPGTGGMAGLTCSHIMVCWGFMTIRTISQPRMINRNLQPGGGIVAARAGSRVMWHWCLMTTGTVG